MTRLFNMSIYSCENVVQIHIEGPTELHRAFHQWTIRTKLYPRQTTSWHPDSPTRTDYWSPEDAKVVLQWLEEHGVKSNGILSKQV